MLHWDAWHFPDGEVHLPKRMRKFNILVPGLDGVPRQTYQYPLYQVALAQCRERRVAVDVGAHVGLMSYWMVRDFAQVVAFEPVKAHQECWRVNVPAREEDRLHACALGAKPGWVHLETPPGSSGGTHIAGPGDIPLETLDRFALPVVDLLKIDVEGYELDVVRGAGETLARCRPVVCVEQRARTVAAAGHGPVDAVKLLQRLGAVVAWTDKSDYVLRWA